MQSLRKRLLDCGDVVPEIRDDRPAKPDRPAVISIREEDALEGMLGAAALDRPVVAAVQRVNDRSLRADGPAFARVKKLHVKEINGNCGILSLPRAATVHRVIDAAATANRPSSAIVDERSRRETN